MGTLAAGMAHDLNNLLVSVLGNASLAREFEPTETTIRNWVAQAARDAGVRTDGLTTEERKELNELRREVRTLREERDILKKATAYFARESL